MSRRIRTRNNRKKSSSFNKKKLLIIGGSTLLFLIFISVIFSLINFGNKKIAIGIKIGDIDMSNLSQEEATQKLEELYNETILKDINIKYNELEKNINLEEFDCLLDIDKLVKEACLVGKSGNIIKDNYDILFTLLFSKKIDMEINLNEEKLNKKIEELNGELPDAMEDSNYYIEEENLIITKGKKGIIIDEEKFKKSLKTAMLEAEERFVEIPVKEVFPKEIDIEEIKNEIFKEAKNASIEKEPIKVIPEIKGVDFAISIEEAKEILNQEQEEYIIPLNITIPEITLDELGKEAFPQMLATFSTTYSTENANRENNLKLASEKIDETIVLPGETFSYNKVVGERTIAKGYKEAAVYSGGKVVDGIGGGICQLSSTLYNAVVYANLEVTQRCNHRFLTSYVSAGRDATVSYGTIDFCFVNTRNYPIKILSSVKNGVVTTEIYGIKEEKEYEVEILAIVNENIPYETKYVNDSSMDEGVQDIRQYGANGANSTTYKILRYDNAIVSREVLSVDTYSPLERIIKKGTKRVAGASAKIFADGTEEKTEEINPELLDSIKEL